MPAIYTKDEFIAVMLHDANSKDLLTADTIEYGIKKYGSLGKLYEHYLATGVILAPTGEQL